ncbi:MAG: lipopolysaccharide biosynthesis protein [Nocardioidaceae bacterium]
MVDLRRFGGAAARPAVGQAARDRLGRAARGSVWNLAGAAISAIANFALTILVTRALTRSDAGVFFSATALFLLATGLGQLGTSTGLVYFLSRARANQTLVEASAYMRTAMRPVLVIACLMGVALLAFKGPVADLAGGDHSAQFSSYLLALAVFIPVAALANLALSGTRGLGTMRPGALLDQMFRPLLQLALVGLAVVLSVRQFVVWGWVIPYLPLAVACWLAWRRLSVQAGGRPGRADAPRRVQGFWRFSAPRAVASVAQAAMQRLDIVLVGAIAGVGQAAVYAAATRFLALGQMAAAAVSQAVQPQLGEALVHRDRVAVGHLYKTSTGWLIALTWPLYLIFITFAATLLGVFGGGYAQGTLVLILLSSSMLVATGCGMVDMVLLMGGRASWNLYNVLGAFVVNLGVDLWLIPRLGILGAAIGWTLAILVTNLVPLVQVALSLRVQPVGAATLTTMVLGLACFGAVPGAIRLLFGEGWPTLLVGIGIGLVCYVTGLWRCRRVLELSVLRTLRRRRT